MNYLPPFYTLHALFVTHPSGPKLLEPKFPIQIVPVTNLQCNLLLFGSDNHALVNRSVWNCSVATLTDGLPVNKIIYSAHVVSQLSPTDTARKVSAFAARFVHEFEHDVVTNNLGLHIVPRRGRGGSFHQPLFEYQRNVSGMPQLPGDWSYMQFVA